MLHLSRSRIDIDSEESTKIYFHIEEYQGDAYVFNLRIIRDLLSFYETFESSFVQSTKYTTSRKQSSDFIIVGEIKHDR